MMAKKGLPVLHKADRPLHLPAKRQNLPRAPEAGRQGQRPRHAPARAAQHHGRGRAFHAVIQPPGDVAVMAKQGIGEPTKLLARLVITDHLRFTRQVAAGHDKRPAEGIAKQVVQRRVGQHDPQRRHPRCHAVRQNPARGDQNDGCGRVMQQRKIGIAQNRHPRQIGRAAHQGQRL